MFVVNKADRDGADAVVRDLRQMVGVVAAEPYGWARPIVRVSAMSGTGVAELVEAIDAHGAWAEGSDEALRRKVDRATVEIEALALARLREQLAPSGRATTRDLGEAAGAGGGHR